ncbi:MAG: hydroxymethylbilane synthase [Syntrophorhabdales bacterium]
MKRKWIIGTRGSKLALVQTGIVVEALSRLYPEFEFTVKKIKTTGDSIWNKPLYLIGRKGLFIKEIEEALAGGAIDLAVHSIKDLPTELFAGLALSAILEREDPRDAFICPKTGRFTDVRQGARIGTSSMRRKAQALAPRPDIEVVPLRGNVDTRIRRLDEEDLDALILACAGVRRMGFHDRIREVLPLDVMVPPCGQGAIGIETRSSAEAAELVRPLNHEVTAFEVGLERRFLAGVGGGCSVPLGINASVSGTGVVLRAFYGEENGTTIFKDRLEGSLGDGPMLTDRLLADLRRARDGHAQSDPASS